MNKNKKIILISLIIGLMVTTVAFFIGCGTSVQKQETVGTWNISKVWAVDDGTKVKATDLNHPLMLQNGIFDGSRIKIFGCRNETVAFQIILQGGTSDTPSVQVKFDSIGPIANTGITNNPDTYYIGRNIELFKEEYLNVTKRSHGLVWEGTSGAQIPADLTGLIPDPLVPLNLLSNGFTVPAGRNQGVWIDIYIPKSVSSGTYESTISIQLGNKVFSQLPVELEVVNATIPDKPTDKTMLWFSGNDTTTVLKRFFPDPYNVSTEQVQALMSRFYRLARRHSITLFFGQDAAPDDYILGLLNGSVFSASAGYYGWGIGQGQDMYSIHTYGGTLSPTEANTWDNWFKANAPAVEYFLYVQDEPPPEDFSQVNQIALNAKPVPSFVTTAYTPDLSNIDIFCELPDHFSVQNATQAQALGKRIWAYNGERPFSGTFATDDVAISPRVNPWIQYKYSIPRWFYWESTYYNNFQAGSQTQTNVFEQPLTFVNGDGDEVNGDGLLIYPGRDYVFPNEDRGFNGPLPSIRLKNWRRGIQDVEYLVLAKTAGFISAHNEALQIITKALADETDYFQAVGWPENGEMWLEARRKLALLFR